MDFLRPLSAAQMNIGWTHLDTLAPCVQIDTLHGVHDVLPLDLHATRSLVLDGTVRGHDGIGSAAESLAVAVDLGLLEVAGLLDLREGHVVVVGLAGIVPRVLDIGSHLGDVRVVDDAAAGPALDVVASEGAALEHIVQAGLLCGLAVIGVIAIAGIIACAQIGRSLAAIHHALHLVGVLEYAYGQTAAIEAGLELVVRLRTRIRLGRLDEAGSQLRTAVAIAGALTAAITVVHI